MSVGDLFDAVARRLVDQEPGVERGRILHSVGLKTGAGKFFAFVANDDLVVKLPASGCTC